MSDQHIEFEEIIPIVKAVGCKNGNVWLHGVASDESLDLQGEVTLAGGLKRSLGYLRKFGKFNDDHRCVNVGEILKADVLSKGELVEAGVLDADLVPQSAMHDEVLYVAGPLYKHVPRARYYRDVLRSGGRLGFSIQGKVLERDVQKSAGCPVTVNRECFVNKIAITDQPVNPNTWARLRKSLTDELIDWPWHIMGALEELADEPRMGGIAKFESAPIQKSESAMEQRLPYEVESAVLLAAARNGLVDEIVVTQHELNRAIVSPTLIKSLERDLRGKGLLGKSLDDVDVMGFNPQPWQVTEILLGAIRKGLLRETAITEFELGSFRPTKELLKSLQIQLDN